MEWKELNLILDGWLRWQRQRRGLRWGLRGLAVGLSLAVLVALILLPRHALLPTEFLSLGLAVPGLGLALGAAAGLFWPLDRVRMARGFDLSFGLRERVSTALELHPGSDAATPTDQAWRERQLADALEMAGRVEPGRLRPLRFERWPLLCSALLALGLIVLGVAGQSGFQAAQQERQVAQAIQAEKQQIAGLVEQIQKAQDLTPAQKEALSRPLQEALERLQTANTREQAVSALSQAQEQLNALPGGSADPQTQALQKAGQQLAASGGPADLQAAGQALAQGDLAKASQALQHLDPNSMTPEQRQAASQALGQAAQTLNQSAAQGAQGVQQAAAGQALQNAAQALAQGNPQAAQQALQQAGQAIQQSAQNQSMQQSAQAQLTQGQANLAHAGQSAQGQAAQTGQANQGQTGGQGQSNQNGQANASGQTNQPDSGSQTGGGGAGHGQANGPDSPSGAAGQSQIGQNNGPGDGGEKPSEPVYASGGGLGGTSGSQVNLPGSGQPGSQNLGQQPSAPGQPGQSQVPYVDVLPSYSNAYRQAIENGEAPAYLLPAIRQYFSSLQP